jgi:4-amino-4-deoxy-L-arabinose transferase-like glycosyltransferase
VTGTPRRRSPGIPFPAAALALGLVVALPAMLLLAVFRFDGLYGQDSFSYVDYALGPLRAALLALQPPPPFTWPPGYPLVVAAASVVAGPSAWVGVAVSLLAGALVPVLVALLAHRLVAIIDPSATDRPRVAVPLLAGLVAATAGQLWQSSVVSMSDTLGAASVTAAAWAVCSYAATGRLPWLAGAAVAAALAIQVRWIHGLAVLPLALVAVVAVIHRPRGAAVRHVVVAAAVGLVVAVPTLGPMLGAAVRGGDLPFSVNFEVFEWRPENALRSSFETADGRLDYGLPSGLFYLLQPIQPYWFAALGVLAIPGAVRAVRSRAVVAIGTLVAWPAIELGFLAGGAYQNTRFFLAAMPPVAILIALGAGEVWRVTAPLRRRRDGPLGGRIAALAITLCLVINAGLATIFTARFIARQAADQAAIRSLAAMVPVDATFVSLGATPSLRHAGRADVVELYDLDEAEVAVLGDAGSAAFVLVDLDAIHRQWADLPAGRALVELERSGTITVMATAGVWTLLRTPPSAD